MDTTGPLNITQVRQVAWEATEGGGAALARFQELAKAAGFQGRRGGWIYHPDTATPGLAICQGWKALAQKVYSGGPNGWALGWIMTAQANPVQAACPNNWHRSAHARMALECPECQTAAAQELDRLEEPAEELEDMEPVVTGETALAAIGGCWAGGALTGKALKAHTDGDYTLALALATDQKALQAEREAAGDAREVAGDRLATVETLGDVAADLLSHQEAAEVAELVADGQSPALAQALVLELKVPTPSRSLARDLQLAAYSAGQASLAAQDLPGFTELARTGVRVAPLAGPCQPTPEDLNDLAAALVAEDLEAPDLLAGVPTPATHRVVPGDVVRIHRGVRLYEVLRVEEDRARNNLTGEVADMTMARVAPCDPEDQREAQWVHVDLLHVVPPVARLQTQRVSHDVAITRDMVMVAGAGWDPERGEARRVALILVDGTRTLAILRTTFLGKGVRPVGVLRIGDALVVDGRCYRVVWHGEGHAEPTLEPARWRDRLPA